MSLASIPRAKNMVHGGSNVVAMGKSKRQGYRKGAGQCAGQWLAARAQKGKKKGGRLELPV